MRSCRFFDSDHLPGCEPRPDVFKTTAPELGNGHGRGFVQRFGRNFHRMGHAAGINKRDAANPVRHDDQYRRTKGEFGIL